MRPRTILFVGNFFFSLFAVVTVYVLFPFLASYVGAVQAGFIIAFGGLVSVILFPFLPGLVARYGAQRIVRALAVVEALALLALAIAPNALTGSILGILTMAMQPIMSYQLDILLESVTDDPTMVGRIRTIFLTAWNLGVLSGPLLIGILLDSTNEYNRAFLAGAIALVPFVALLTKFPASKRSMPAPSHIQDTLVCISRDPDLGSITFAHFLLYLFYIWAPLYVPLYLHTVLGLPWSTLGWMFSIMLVPYVLVEYPAGWLADTFLGDKKLLFAGFIITGTAFASLGFITAATSIWLILGILISSRVGAALVEAMTESHFFRRVSQKDVNSISVFRGIWPLANAIGPVVGGMLLSFGSYPLLFIATGLFLLIVGAITTARIQDGRVISTYPIAPAYSDPSVSQ